MGKTDKIVQKIRDVGLKVHMQLLSNDEGVDGFSWTPEELTAVREEMDALLDRYPRITSYNVCYTKLLRNARLVGGDLGIDSIDVLEMVVMVRNNFV